MIQSKQNLKCKIIYFKVTGHIYSNSIYLCINGLLSISDRKLARKQLKTLVLYLQALLPLETLVSIPVLVMGHINTLGKWRRVDKVFFLQLLIL